VSFVPTGDHKISVLYSALTKIQETTPTAILVICVNCIVQATLGLLHDYCECLVTDDKRAWRWIMNPRFESLKRSERNHFPETQPMSEFQMKVKSLSSNLVYLVLQSDKNTAISHNFNNKGI